MEKNLEPRIILSVQTSYQGETATIDLNLELINYVSRHEMANRLRQLAHWVDEGLVCPFDVPAETGTWTLLDDESGNASVTVTEQGGDRG